MRPLPDPIFYKMVKVGQIFADDHLEDTAAVIRATAAPLAAEMTAGKTAAVLVGSRGITDIDLIAKAVVDVLKDAGVCIGIERHSGLFA